MDGHVKKLQLGDSLPVYFVVCPPTRRLTPSSRPSMPARCRSHLCSRVFLPTAVYIHGQIRKLLSPRTSIHSIGCPRPRRQNPNGRYQKRPWLPSTPATVPVHIRDRPRASLPTTEPNHGPRSIPPAAETAHGQSRPLQPRPSQAPPRSAITSHSRPPSEDHKAQTESERQG